MFSISDHLEALANPFNSQVEVFAIRYVASLGNMTIPSDGHWHEDESGDIQHFTDIDLAHAEARETLQGLESQCSYRLVRVYS